MTHKAERLLFVGLLIVCGLGLVTTAALAQTAVPGEDRGWLRWTLEQGGGWALAGFVIYLYHTAFLKERQTHTDELDERRAREDRLISTLENNARVNERLAQLVEQRGTVNTRLIELLDALAHQLAPKA